MDGWIAFWYYWLLTTTVIGCIVAGISLIGGAIDMIGFIKDLKEAMRGSGKT